MTAFRASFKEVWNRLSWLDLASTALSAGGLILTLLGKSGGLASFLKYLAVLAGIYLLSRFICWGGNRPLWGVCHPPHASFLFFAGESTFFYVSPGFISG